MTVSRTNCLERCGLGVWGESVSEGVARTDENGRKGLLGCDDMYRKCIGVRMDGPSRCRYTALL